MSTRPERAGVRTVRSQGALRAAVRKHVYQIALIWRGIAERGASGGPARAVEDGFRVRLWHGPVPENVTGVAFVRGPKVRVL